MNSHSQKPIMATANDAILSKLSTSQLGYYYDPFLPYMAKNAVGLTSTTASVQRTNQNHSPIAGSIGQMTNQLQFEGTNMNSLGSNNMHPHPHPFPNPMLQKRVCLADRHPPRVRRSGVNAPSSLTAVTPGQAHHQPVIRRGTHARVCVVDYAISTFLSLCQDLKEVQVVILGSGRDTTYLRSQCDLLHDKCPRNDSEANQDKQSSTNTKHRTRGNVTWYEVDHPSVINDKHDLLLTCDLFDFKSQKVMDGEKMKSFIISPTQIRSGNNIPDNTISNPSALEPCHLVSYDLRNSFELLLHNMQENHGLQNHVPTLFVMECVQMYLPEEGSRDILRTITEAMAHPIMAIFDPIIQYDGFGQVMAQNLIKARITDSSMSLVNTRTLSAQLEKLKDCGFKTVTGCDFYSAYEMVLTAEDRRRANMAEMLDEVEEWMLIARHYCFLVAAGGAHRKSDDDIRERDDDIREQGHEHDLQEIEEAFCSVEDGNVFGFVAKKCVCVTATSSSSSTIQDKR